MIELILPREVKSGNSFAYSHWRVRYKDKIAWRVLIGSVVASGGLSKATGPRRVTFTAYRKRRLDDDNLIAGLKHCRDMLVYHGLLLDDNRASATFTYNDALASHSPIGKPCTKIVIEDI